MTTKSIVANGQEISEVYQIMESSFDSAVDGIARGTQSIDDAFKGMAQSVILQLGKVLAEFLAVKAVTALFGGGTGGGGGATLAQGGVMDGGRLQPFARGGIVSSPTVFPMANGAGLMGEAGPEAIMPLGRNSKGELGVKGGGVNVVINNMAPGVDVKTRETEQGLTVDIVLQQAASAVRRGGNAFSQSLEDTFSLSRGRGAY